MLDCFHFATSANGFIFIGLPDAKLRPQVLGRPVGGLTGSRVAGALARIPIEDLVAFYSEYWKEKGFERRISIGTWVDNLVFAS